MTLGSPSIAQWGTPFWGDIEFDPSLFLRLESVARGDQQKTLTFDNLAERLDAQRLLTFDSLGEKTLSLSLQFDIFQGRIPTADFLADCTQNVILIEMRLPAGTRRFATIPLKFGGEAYEGRQVSITTIQRTQGSGTDDLQVKLDDTDQDGQDRLRDVFLADSPEGSGVTVFIVLLNDKAKNRYPLFEGSIERVAGFSRAVVTIDVVRNEAVEDVELGRPVTLADFPNAPDESLSTQRPIVLGEVEAHEGVAVDVNALGKLARSIALPSAINQPAVPTVQTFFQAAQNVLIPQTSTPNVTVLLVDAGEFPAAGSILIDSEEISYTGKNGNELTGIIRGLNGTLQGEHSKGTEVKELGDFVLLFADHALSKLENIRIQGSDGVLGEPVPDPSSVDFANALVTWPETPKVRNPNAAAEFRRIHFRDVDPANKARGAEFTARENPAYRAFGVSQLGSGEMVLRTNTDGLGVPGDLLRVWIACIFDPDTLQVASNSPFTINPTTGFFSLNPLFNPSLPASPPGISGGAQVIVGNKGFNLQTTDLVPEAIARQDEKTGDRIYDVPDPVLKVQPSKTGAEILSPDTVVQPGIWQRDEVAEVIIDGDEQTEAVAFFAGFGEAKLQGRGEAIFVLNTPPDLGTFAPVGQATLVFIGGWGPPNIDKTSPLKITLINRLTQSVVVTFVAPSGGGTIFGVQRFEGKFDSNVFDDDLGNLPDFDWKVSPFLDTNSGLWVARELFVEMDTVSDPPLTTATVRPKGSVTNYFEVTDLVGLSRTKDAAADWGFFSDLNRGGRATFRSNISVVAFDPQVLETFWVAEFTPFLNASTRVPRGFADVRGLTGPSGDDTPADIAEQIITRPAPLGMGLPTSRINRANYNPTKLSLLADGIRMGFAIVKPTSAVKIIESIADQGDCRQSWDRRQHSLIRRPQPDVSLPVFRTLTELNDILLAPAIKLGRTSLGEARTRITGLYRIFAPSGKTSRSVELFDAAAEVSFGRKAETVTIDLIRDDTSATFIIQRLLDRRKRPRWSIELDMALPGLELRFGDLVTIQHKDIPDGSFEVCEVLGLNFQTGGFDRVRVTCVVWLE